MTLRIGVIGVGHLGKHHARILSSLPGVQLVAVVDTNRERAAHIAATTGARAAFDDRELLGQVDAVTIAVPTELHRDVALPFLRAGVPVVTNRVDIANARLRFANGCIVNLTASRISRDRVRKIRFFQPSAYVSIDYATQKVEVYRLVQGSGPAPSIEGGELEVVNEEPLKRELADFVDAIVARRAPRVTGEAGRRALSLAQAITDKIETQMRPRRHEDTKEMTKKP